MYLCVSLSVMERNEESAAMDEPVPMEDVKAELPTPPPDGEPEEE